MTQSDTKTALLDCAQDLIQRVGVNAMSYKDLADKVGIRKASIHYHFPKKDDLIQCLLSRCHENYSCDYGQIANCDKSAPEKFMLIADMFAESLKNNKMCLVGMLSVEHATLSDEVKSSIVNNISDSLALFSRIAQQGIEEGSIKPDADSGLVAHGLLSMLLGAQVIARCTGDLDGFTAAIRAHVDSLAP